ncbi:hypothetical protein [Bifidobacterium pullorum]|uniref:hypothetical protein n=1 Tax=Bifidobacterium pullorum TaxID=78448 RepID=UPI00126A5048|nr:hypothetical protein [Bifidobacterium pullorum]
MDKLQYDSLYKFLVSLGIILIALPIAALVYLLNSEPILISQSDFDALSEYSQQMIGHRDSITTYFIDIFPWFGGIFICLGVLFLGYGIYKWTSVQKNLDKKLDAEATMQTLSLMEMSAKEVEAKVEEEVSEETSAETVDEPPPISEDTHLCQINRYKEIEDLCYNYFTAKYSRNYTFKQNIRMGKYHCDFIGVSKKDNIDLLVEVKYWKSPVSISGRLKEVLYRLFDAGVNYETIAHRNFTLLVVIVTTKEQLPRLEGLVETHMKHFDNRILNKLDVKCIAEEAL